MLDGQQRLTSLYQALYGVGDYRYFVDFKILADDDGPELERALTYLPQKKADMELGSVAQQADALLLPLPTLRDPGFDEWLDEVVERRELVDEAFDSREFKKKIRPLYKAHVKPLLDYSFPVVDLPKSTSLEAVCKVFETLNRTGIKLTVFELLVARFWPQGISLRQLWDDAREQYEILEDFDIDPFWLLQAICLRAGGPSPSVQRGDVLKLDGTAINAHWSYVVDGAVGALELLRDDCGVLTPKWMPYATVLVPLAALWPKVASMPGPDEGAARQKLTQYFWSSVFTAAFDASPNSAAVKHYQELTKWLDGGPEPEVLRNFDRFDPDLLLDATTGQRALYRGVMALTVRHGALDFHNSKKLTAQRLQEQKIDAHHVFPSAFLKQQAKPGQGSEESLPADLVLNRALIDKETNRRIKARAPSDYIAEIAKAISDVPKILESHLLPSGNGAGLMHDDYDGFILERQALVVRELEMVTGRKVQKQANAPIGDPA